MKKPFTCVALAFVALVGLAHLTRVIMGVEIKIGGMDLPVWLSAPAAIFCLALVFLAGREMKKE